MAYSDWACKLPKCVFDEGGMAAMISHPALRVCVKKAVLSRTVNRFTPSEAPEDVLTVKASGFALALVGKATPSTLNQYAERKRAPKFPVSVRLWQNMTSGWLPSLLLERTMADDDLERRADEASLRSTLTVKYGPDSSELHSPREARSGVGTGLASRIHPLMMVSGFNWDLGLNDLRCVPCLDRSARREGAIHRRLQSHRLRHLMQGVQVPSIILHHL